MCTTLFKCQVLGKSYRIVKDDSNELVPFIVQSYSSYRRKWLNLAIIKFESYRSAVAFLSRYINCKFLGAAYSSEFLQKYEPRLEFPDHVCLS